MTKEKEVWKDIPGYQGYYQISNLGRVKSLQRTITHKPSKKFPNGRVVIYKERELIPSTDSSGYLFVQLYKSGVFKSKRIHRLVAETFLQNDKNCCQVNHKDENKHNNNVSNLEWCTAKYNINYGTGKYRKVTNNIPVIQYSKSGEFIAEYNSATAATYALNIPQFYARDILRVCRGRGKTVQGFIWKLKNKL